jgi:hypothetical protein
LAHHVLAELTGTLPRVVIDDLDRAKVDQQRAFLRAILRFSRQMHFAVVVCMDERGARQQTRSGSA